MLHHAKSKTLKRYYILLWLTALIWGFAFVAQRKGMEFIGPNTFNGIRFAMGSLSLIPLIIFFHKKQTTAHYSFNRNFLLSGIVLGLVLFAAAWLQQAGMVYTSAGKAGFITGLYVILVPGIGYFLGQRITTRIIMGAFMALTGLFLLILHFPIGISKGDLLVLISALFWAVHVQLVNYLARKYSPLHLSALQFAVCSIISLVFAFTTETVTLPSIRLAFVPLLYGGFLSVGVAYTLQVVVQKHVNPSIAAIILSFETVFAAIGGWLLLYEHLSLQNIAGCIIMLVGIIVVQAIPEHSSR